MRAPAAMGSSCCGFGWDGGGWDGDWRFGWDGGRDGGWDGGWDWGVMSYQLIERSLALQQTPTTKFDVKPHPNNVPSAHPTYAPTPCAPVRSEYKRPHITTHPPTSMRSGTPVRSEDPNLTPGTQLRPSTPARTPAAVSAARMRRTSEASCSCCAPLVVLLMMGTMQTWCGVGGWGHIGLRKGGALSPGQLDNVAFCLATRLLDAAHPSIDPPTYPHTHTHTHTHTPTHIHPPNQRHTCTGASAGGSRSPASSPCASTAALSAPFGSPAAIS